MGLDSVFDLSVVGLAVILLIAAAAIVRSAFGRGSGEVGGWALGGAGRRIRAVAKITLAEGLRMKIAIVFVVLLAVTLPLVCLTAKGDGTIRGRVEMFLGYSVGLTGFYLSLLTIFFSSRTLAAEIASYQIFGLASKPIPRWQILAGKWLGVTILNVLLVAFAVAFTYGGTRWILYRFHDRLHDELVQRCGLSDAQAWDCIDAVNNLRGAGGEGYDSPIIPAMAGALGWTDDRVADALLRLPEATRVDLRRLDELRRQVLVGRAAVRPERPDLSIEVEKQYEFLDRAGRLPRSPEWSPDRIREQIRAALTRQYTTVPYLGAREWVIHGPAPKNDADFLLSVRYRLDASVWGDAVRLEDGTLLEENTILARWTVGDPERANHVVWPPRPRAEANNKPHEFEVPVRCVEPDGTIRIAMQNVDPRRFDVVAPLEDGLEVLYRVGPFEQNVVAAGLALLVPLFLLAGFGLTVSTFCTFPVAAMVGLAFYAIASTRSFVLESLALTPAQMHVEPNVRQEVRKLVTDALYDVLSLGSLAPTDRLAGGRAILWPELGREAADVAGLRTAAALLIGVLVFRRRELASVVVSS